MKHKTNFYVILIIFIFMNLTIGTLVKADSDLTIDSDILKGSEFEAYTSLTDLYEIPLFTEKIMLQKENIKEQQKQEKEKINNFIFSSENFNKKDSKEYFIEQVNEYKLFNNRKVEKKIKYEEHDYSFQVEIIVTIVSLGFLTSIFTIYYKKRKNKKAEKDNEYNNYYRL